MAEKLSELFVAMTDWMRSIGVTDASKGEQPWRGELIIPDDVLRVSLNASKQPVEDDGITIEPYHAVIRSKKYLGVALLNPFGGSLAGFREDDLIKAFQHSLTEAGNG